MANQRQSRQEIKQGLNVQKCELNRQQELLKILNSATENAEKGNVFTAIEELNRFLQNNNIETKEIQDKVRMLFRNLHIIEITYWLNNIGKNNAVLKII